MTQLKMSVNKKKFLVQPKLPRAGLGNMLLVWARAVLFAEINTLPLALPNWRQLRIGPYLRGERDKRNYSGLFQSTNYISIEYWLLTNILRYKKYSNPNPLPIDLHSLEKDSSSHIFIFSSIPHWSDYFEYLKEYQPLIREKLLSDIRPHILREIEDRPAPKIGIHLRMGDFKFVQPGEELPGDNSRTPLKWFVRIINCIRSLGYDVPVTIFSDAHDDELEEIISLPDVYRSPKNNALSDILTLSKSQILVASSGSTFSSWASYLGQCPTIYYPSQFQSSVFPKAIRDKVFEGEFDPQLMVVPDLLLRNIKAAFSRHHD
jgi:Glycosyl transferase family 11